MGQIPISATVASFWACRHASTVAYMASATVAYRNQEQGLTSDYPSRASPKMMIRMPNGLRERIQESAKRNRRSANAEVVVVLEREFGASAAGGDQA
nr:Arc family DNA-binding protein [Brevundimonas naejangsanensis]